MSGSTGRWTGRILALCAACAAVATVTPTGPAVAAFEFVAIGSRAGGMGEAYSAVASGAEGLFWNPATVVGPPGFSACAGMDRPFGMAELDTHSLAAGWSGTRLGLAVGLTSFGPAAYREATAAGALGWRVSRRARLGVAVRRLAIAVAGVGDREWLVFDLGACASLGKTVEAGLWARNAGGTATGLVSQGGSLGLRCTASERMLLSADLLKEAGLPTGLGIGIEYSVCRGVWLRGGAGGEPERTSLGFGLAKGSWILDYAAIYHTVLGLTHRVSVSFRKGADRPAPADRQTRRF